MARLPLAGEMRDERRSAARRTRFWTFMLAIIHPATFALTTVLRDRIRENSTKATAPRTSDQRHSHSFVNAIRNKQNRISHAQVSDIFFNALIQAYRGSCPLVGARLRPNVLSSPSFHARRQYFIKQQSTHHKTLSPPRRPLTREDSFGMLDYYPNTETYSTACAFSTSPIFSYPPFTIVSEHGDHAAKTVPALPPEPTPNVEDEEQYRELHTVLLDPEASHEETWTSLRHRLAPHVLQLSPTARARLLQKLSIIRRRNRESMWRYLSVVEELKTHGIELTEHQYNSVIAFSAHLEDRPSVAGVEAALLAWKEMENEAGITPTHVTFNILFDKATKAGKFALAEVLWKQIESRGLEVTRFGRVSLIFYHGLRGDGHGVRQAYRDFIEAGEIVDTLVINCVIASLIRAGELPAAEQVYERLKLALHLRTGVPVPYLDWKEPRSLGRELERASRYWRNDPEKLQEIRDQQNLAPSQHTFNIFVDHHACVTGEIKRIAQLLAEMQQLGVPMCGRIFVKILKGFSFHGGMSYTSWTLARLENAYASLLDALDQGLGDGRPGKWMVIWAVRAFFRCSSHDRALQIWDEMLERWQPTAKERKEAEDKVADILGLALRKSR